MTVITDEYFRERYSKLKEYAMVILKPTSKFRDAGADALIKEHGRRNMALQADGGLSIVCPVYGSPDIAGIYIFNRTVDEVRRIMEDDPAVKEGIFDCEVYTCKGFPGDSLA